MKVSYDKGCDALYVSLSTEQVAESDEDNEGVIIDYSERGSIVGIEVLNASKKLPHPNKVESEFL
jgi:uncharacterized protein YuzE